MEQSFVEFALELLARQKVRPVRGHADAALFQFEQFDRLVLLAGAEN